MSAIDTTTMEWGESPYTFTTSDIDFTSERLPYAYFTPEVVKDSDKAPEPFKITFIPKRNCIFSASKMANDYRINAINDLLERMHDLLNVSLDFLEPYFLYSVARDMRILPAAMAEDPDYFPTASELLEVMILSAVSHMLKLPLDGRCWNITKASGEPYETHETVDLSEEDAKDQIPQDDIIITSLNPVSVVKLYSMVNVFVVQLVTLFSEHVHLRLNMVKSFMVSYAAMKELPLDDLENTTTSIPVAFIRFPIITFRSYHWLDGLQQQLFVTCALTSPLCKVCPPSLPYTLRNLQSLTKRIERAGVAIDENLLLLTDKIFKDRALAISCGGKGLNQRPGELMLSHRSYFPTTMGISRGKLTYDKLDAWQQGAYTVAVNEAIGNVGFSLWPGAMLLAEYIMNQPEIFDGKCLVEMGAGVGLSASIIPYVSSPKRFVTTDYLGDILRVLADNIRLNGVPVVYENGFCSHSEEDEDLPVPTGVSIPPIPSTEISSSHPLPTFSSMQLKVEEQQQSTKSSLSSPLSPVSPVIRVTSPSIPVEVCQLDWCEPDIGEISGWNCDISLSADCVYAPELIIPHLSCMRILMGLEATFESVDIDKETLHRTAPTSHKFCVMAFQKRNPETFERLTSSFGELGLFIESIALDSIPHKFSDYYSRNLMFLFHIKPLAASA